VRHGERVDEVDGEERRRWITSLEQCADGNDGFDPPLTIHGVAQAADAARSLRALLPQPKPFDVVFCSPLVRCVQTAEHFAYTFGIPITLVPGLGECCAALHHRSRSAKRRWPLLQPLEQLRVLCPRASFTVPDIASLPERFEDGPLTCAGSLAQGRRRVLLISHRESIRSLAKRQQSKDRKSDDRNTPYACIGLFHCYQPTTVEERWRYYGLVRRGAVMGGMGFDPAATKC